MGWKNWFRNADRDRPKPDAFSEFEEQLKSLAMTSIATLEATLTESVHFRGNHWIQRAKRGEGTASEVTAHIRQIMGLYNRHQVETIRRDTLGPLTNRGIENVLTFIVLSTVAVPYLIVRIGDDRYSTFYFEGT